MQTFASGLIYKYRFHTLIVLCFISFFYVNKVNPPLSSPDEHYHFVRADTLSRGEIILGRKGDRATGTEIDSEYIAFMQLFNMLGFDKSRTSMQASINNAKSLHWSNDKVYLESANVAIYFPAIYAPQATAIAIGKASGLNIYNTYMLARFLTFSFTVAVLFFAWKVYRIPSLALAVLALPMSVFQFFAASIDGEIIALTVLIMSLYSSLMSSDESGRKWKTILIYLAIFVIGTCKANLASLLVLPFSLAFILKDKKHLVYSILTASLIIGWTALAVINTRDAGGQHGGH